MSQEHRLKTLENYWDAVQRGEKTFEVRRNDRGFQTGDFLVLQKIDEDGLYYTDDDSEPLAIRKQISYLLQGGQFGIEPGYCVLGLAEAEPANAD